MFSRAAFESIMKNEKYHSEALGAILAFYLQETPNEGIETLYFDELQASSDKKKAQTQAGRAAKKEYSNDPAIRPIGKSKTIAIPTQAPADLTKPVAHVIPADLNAIYNTYRPNLKRDLDLSDISLIIEELTQQEQDFYDEIQAVNFAGYSYNGKDQFKIKGNMFRGLLSGFYTIEQIRHDLKLLTVRDESDEYYRSIANSYFFVEFEN